MSRVVVDPVARINGQLRIEAELAGGVVTDAWSSGTMFRGIESVLNGRDPREAWLIAERICGTCTGVHSLASVRAVEDALGVKIPTNARVIRNLMAATQLVRDHVVSFYQSQLPDWADARSGATGDPLTTSSMARMLGDWPGSTENDLTGVRDRLASLVASGSGGLLGSGWWGHPGYALSPEQNLLLFAHYAEALDWQSKFMRIHAILGGKDPHAQTYLVGGMALAPPWGGPDVRLNRGHPDVPQHNSPDPLGEDGLTMIDDLLREGRRFVEQVFLPDVRLVADAYRDWTAIGDGGTGYLAFGDYPQRDGAAPDLFLPRGSVASGTLRVDDVDEAKVAEAVVHAWYQDESIAAGHLVPPASGDTNPDFDLDLPIASLEGADRYTWVKAPRYEGRPMETGPLARVMVAYADGQPEVGTTLSELLRGLSLGPEAMASVIGRLLARAVEAQVVVIRAANWLRELRQHLSTGDLAVADISSWDPGTWPAEAEGWSLGEGPRGAVGHWVSIRDGRVDRYQVVDASTWNASPRDLFGIAGPMEAALAGTAVADEAQPIELLRVIHSYNPCLACAAHLHGGGLTSRVSLRVRHGEGHR